jgi:glycosyltransferase involved in cell wall biosynthesis
VEISAVVITFHEEKRLEAALRSLKGVVSEIIVVDSFSTDDTLKIARKYTARAYERAWTHYADQKNHADGLASFPWILSLDADERLSSVLRDELLKLRGKEPACAGFSVPREAYYLGRWIRHSGWHPDRRVRLFRRDRARWEGDYVHERLVVDGDVEKLHGPVHHFTFETIGEHAARVNKFSGLAAQKLYARRKKGRILPMFVQPPFRFLATYFLRLGFLDGFAGLVIAGLDGYSVFLRQAKLRSIWKKGKHIEPFLY